MADKQVQTVITQDKLMGFVIVGSVFFVGGVIAWAGFYLSYVKGGDQINLPVRNQPLGSRFYADVREVALDVSPARCRDSRQPHARCRRDERGVKHCAPEAVPREPHRNFTHGVYGQRPS